MNFKGLSSLNIWLNLISGNLLPMSGNSSFSIFWKMYSAFVWSLLSFCAIMIVSGCFLVPLEQALVEGVLTLVVMAEAVIVVMRIHGQKILVRNLIEKGNDILKIEDKSINNIVVTNVNLLKVPFKFYLVLGTFSTIFWCSLTLKLIFEKSIFHYTDLKTPVIFFKQPFSVGFFLLSTTLSVVANVYVFLKKVSVDIYTTHFISLITSQYQYIASKLASVFRDGSQQDDSFPENNSRVDTSVEKEIKNLCWQHNNVMSIMKMLKKLISVNVFLVYMSSVLRFCFLGVMLMTMFSSGAFLAAGIVMMYGSGALIQFYILCSAFQKLSEASVEITDEAFHEDWNRFSFSIKRTFLLMKTASSNIVIDLSLFKNFNLSLPSFISIINQAYSISLLLLEMQ